MNQIDTDAAYKLLEGYRFEQERILAEWNSLKRPPNAERHENGGWVLRWTNGLCYDRVHNAAVGALDATRWNEPPCDANVRNGLGELAVPFRYFPAVEAALTEIEEIVDTLEKRIKAHQVVLDGPVSEG